MTDASEPRLIDIPFLVQAHEHGLRIDLFLSRRMQRMSRTLAGDLVRKGRVRREPGGQRVERPSARVFEGEYLVLQRKPLDEGPVDHIEIPTVFEDEVILAVNKPGDLVVHPTASAYRRTVIRLLRTRRNDSFLDLAHRLDKETSGLLLLAKDSSVSVRLMKQFAQRAVQKAYLAVVRGIPPEANFDVDAPLRLDPSTESNCMMMVGGEGAQPARTSFSVLARGLDASLVLARPQTGRQHQIRLHLAHAGFPILGDKLYQRGDAFFIEAVNAMYSDEDLTRLLGHWRHALHAYELQFVHPISGEVCRLRAELPSDLQDLLRRHEMQPYLDESPT
jgi:23S rRNA pseudouridine1911/1915/1917 synthase